MNEIICPKCTNIFKVDQAGFAAIVKQVRDDQFKQEVEEKKEDAVAKAILEKQHLHVIEIAKIRDESRDQLDKKASEVAELKSKLKNINLQIKVAENDAKNAVKKDSEQLINKLKDDVNKSNSDLKDARRDIEFHKQKHEDEIRRLVARYDEEIRREKDFKQKLSTKMIGETLEQWCEREFNKLRPTGFQNAEFGKDNISSSGTKGDYIFREKDKDGNEIISIMFEMKNENNESKTKQKNEEFFAKLDKDRKNKNCEYAVLVSLLESDNEFYNNGIVDVSYQYKFEKMYVIRPQFFVPMITTLRNMAMRNLKTIQDMHTIKNQNIDITKFEDDLKNFVGDIGENHMRAQKYFKIAIDEIDKSISKMNKVKEALITSENQLRLADRKAEKLTIKKLTHKNPTMKQKFDNLKNNSE